MIATDIVETYSRLIHGFMQFTIMYALLISTRRALIDISTHVSQYLWLLISHIVIYSDARFNSILTVRYVAFACVIYISTLHTLVLHFAHNVLDVWDEHALEGSLAFYIKALLG